MRRGWCVLLLQPSLQLLLSFSSAPPLAIDAIVSCRVVTMAVGGGCICNANATNEASTGTPRGSMRPLWARKRCRCDQHEKGRQQDLSARARGGQQPDRCGKMQRQDAEKRGGAAPRLQKGRKRQQPLQVIDADQKCETSVLDGPRISDHRPQIPHQTPRGRLGYRIRPRTRSASDR